MDTGGGGAGDERGKGGGGWRVGGEGRRDLDG